MREIKFRAWDTEAKMWCGMEYLGFQSSGELFWKNIDQDATYVVLQQFTGLKDKNRKDVFEGDILKWRGELNLGNVEVSWNEKRCAFSFGDMLMAVDIQNCEIIGNVFENPELIEKI